MQSSIVLVLCLFILHEYYHATMTVHVIPLVDNNIHATSVAIPDSESDACLYVYGLYTQNS